MFNYARIEWDSVLSLEIPLEVLLNTLPTKGKLVYEYNPFRNYRLSQNKYYYRGLYYTMSELTEEFGITMTSNNKSWKNLPSEYDAPVLYEKGLLVDFITDELNFSLEHPVYIIPQYSYDGSVNLILNDGFNKPRLINSRFSATGRNTYEIVDRSGNNDTNIYDSGDLFDTDTSLYKIVNGIPKVELLGVNYGGNLKVGNYHFYFRLSDADGNETDFVAESGLVSVFIGDSTFDSVHTGSSNENSTKLVEFKLHDLDTAYDYILVYYSRYTAQEGDNYIVEYVKIDKKYSSNSSRIIISGFEETQNITASDLNVFYNLVNAAKTHTTCLNMLFLGNVQKLKIPYKELLDLSLRIYPILNETVYDPGIDYNYNINKDEESYINPKFIYNKTGYWPNELYRFGIVYILPNGELTPVFNIRGGIGITSEVEGLFIPLPVRDGNGERIYEDYNENTNLIISSNLGSKINYENIKGVCSFSPSFGTLSVLGIDFYMKNEVRDELSKYVKGFFYVRQPRMPLVLALGITMGIDKISRTPTIPTEGGMLDSLLNVLETTHVETKDINGLNYISEGFLKRYSFKFKKKSSGLWKKIGKIAGIAAILVGSVICAIIPGGQVLSGLGLSALSGMITTAAAAVGVSAAGIITATAAVAAGVTAGLASALVGAAVATGQEIGQAIRRANAKKELKGRKTEAPKGYTIVEDTDNSRHLTQTFTDRIIIKDPDYNEVLCIICPDYTVNQPYFNQIFTGNTHLIKTDDYQSVNIDYENNTYFDNNDGRHFFIPLLVRVRNKTILSECKIMAVPDNVKCVGLDGNLYRSRAGEAEEVFRYELVGKEYDKEEKKINTDIIRGSFSPYLACTNEIIGPALLVNIYIPGYKESNMQEYIDIRMNDNSTYSAISDRESISVKQQNYRFNDSTSEDKKTTCYRGDCYICQYTLRIFRNFNDPSAPYNDTIVDINTWKNNYDPQNPEKYAEINLGDVNAIQMGMWVTFLLRSSNNLNIRTLSGSNVDETAMVGHKRGYFPYHNMSVEGNFKHPESEIYNKGFTKSLGERWNVGVPDVPYIKNWFGTRIMYSDIHVNDGFKNGFRVFLGTNYRDYTREYGEIVKLISLESNLLCVFEHGIALIPVNERAVAGQGAGGNVFINTSNVLPENPRIISDMFGSQWADSILKVPGKTGDAPQYVYGVDTVAKKIWRTDGISLECISDGKVQEFLNNNITLGERELTPKLGIRNVKTVYNAYKRDVMFTFYDNTYGFEEKVWNLCWNELLLRFITFYSWVPSYMENINNIPFSFDRNTSKWIAKLGISHSENSFADGITLDNVIVNNSERIGKLSISNRILPDPSMEYEIIYSIEHDHYGNYKMFDIIKLGNDSYLCLKNGYSADDLISELYYRNSVGHSYADKDVNKENIILYDENDNPLRLKTGTYDLPIFKDITGKRKQLPRELMLRPDKIVTLLNIKATIKIITEGANLTDDYYNIMAGYATGTTLIDAGYYESTVAVIPKRNLQFLSTDFWKHGQAGIIDIADDIFPTLWYGRIHPFEFECIVVNDPSVHKIFTNLELVANKAKPESFHYEIIGDCYDFAKDKPNMYFRLEARKHIWQYNGADICYDRNYLKTNTKWLVKSADLIHQYYDRQDTINEIEDYYHGVGLAEINNRKYDFSHLSGGEIVYYPNRLEYRIWNHARAISIDDLNLDDARSVITGNCRYLEDKWRITINPIIIGYKNELNWGTDPIIPILNSPIPNTLLNNEDFGVPEELNNNQIDLDNWLVDKYGYGQASNRKEVDLKDTFIKIRIRYSGEELAVISFLNTIYRVSYA